jgi:hypothetical protein
MESDSSQILWWIKLVNYLTKKFNEKVLPSTVTTNRLVWKDLIKLQSVYKKASQRNFKEDWRYLRKY